MSANPVVLQAMQEYADAVRGDWSDFDGRGNRAVIESFIAALGGGRWADWSIEQWRTDLGVCPNGGGHWSEYCDDLSCAELKP